MYVRPASAFFHKLVVVHKNTFTFLPQVNLLTPRFDYPPDPSVEKPSHMIRKQQQPYERMEQFAQSHSPQRQHPPPSAPVTQSLVSDAADSRQQNILQMQYNLALLQMNAMNLPPHQHQELLKLQLQLNHLQQLSLKQQMKTQQLELEAKPASPGMNPVKSSTRLDSYIHIAILNLSFCIALIAFLQFSVHAASALASAPTSCLVAKSRRNTHIAHS